MTTSRRAKGVSPPTGSNDRHHQNFQCSTVMLRRQPTALGLTAEDIASYDSRRQQASTEQAQFRVIVANGDGDNPGLQQMRARLARQLAISDAAASSIGGLRSGLALPGVTFSDGESSDDEVVDTAAAAADVADEGNHHHHHQGAAAGHGAGAEAQWDDGDDDFEDVDDDDDDVFIGAGTGTLAGRRDVRAPGLHLGLTDQYEAEDDDEDEEDDDDDEEGRGVGQPIIGVQARRAAAAFPPPAARGGTRAARAVPPRARGQTAADEDLDMAEGSDAPAESRPSRLAATASTRGAGAGAAAAARGGARSRAGATAAAGRSQGGSTAGVTAAPARTTRQATPDVQPTRITRTREERLGISQGGTRRR